MRRPTPRCRCTSRPCNGGLTRSRWRSTFELDARSAGKLSMVCYRFGEFVLDLDAFVLRRGDLTLPLQPKVLDVLRYLIEHRGRMVPKSELLDALWKGEYVNDATLSWSV